MAAGVGVAGCQQYKPKPLDDGAVDAKLAVPSDGQLQDRAARLNRALFPTGGFNPNAGLTPDSAAVLAVLQNPDLRATEDQRAAAAAVLLQARLLPNPVLSYNPDFLTGGFRTGAFNDNNGTLGWDITALIAHSAKVKAASAGADAVYLSVVWQEWQVAEAAKTAVLDLLSMQAQLKVLKEIDARLNKNFQIVRKAYNERLKTTIDLSAAEAASRNSRAAVLQGQRNVDQQWLKLTRILGLPPGQRPRLKANQALPMRFFAPTESLLLATLSERRIDLVALRRGYTSQEQTLRAAILDQFPKINIGLAGAADNGNVQSVGLVATIDIPIFDHNQGHIAIERATRKRLFDEYAARVYNARADIVAALINITALNLQVADAQAAVPNLQHLVEVYKEAVDRGNADVLSYYVAWNDLSKKLIEVLQLQQQLADTRIALEIASGRRFTNQPVTTQPVTTQPLTTQSAGTQP